MNQDEAEKALAAWASVERDELVRAAHAAGVSKNRIHTITGIARTTIDRILETPMLPAQTLRLSAYLVRFVDGWPRQGGSPWYVQPAMASAYTSDQIAEQLLSDLEFRALKLATFLNTPDGRMLAAAVESLTPALYAQDVTLLIEALTIAGRIQQEQVRETVVNGVVVGAGVALVAALLANANK
ncbi:hypothetical protein [Hamadaea tsunoensis]|uniref:hypothetical protein n=1 Tax=Hamadaea tsunoensis TaxID=53368 RepID=UPI0012FC3245|nr:hypothetical protein [Hamadaea tsunoensis]